MGIIGLFWTSLELILAEAVRFELTKGCPLPVFKTGAIDHSATLPLGYCPKPAPQTTSTTGAGLAASVRLNYNIAPPHYPL